MRYYDYSKTQLENEADSLNESFDKERLIRPKKIDVYDVVDFIHCTPDWFYLSPDQSILGMTAYNNGYYYAWIPINEADETPPDNIVFNGMFPKKTPVEKGTIIIDRSINEGDNRGIENFSCIHECFHQKLHTRCFMNRSANYQHFCQKKAFRAETGDRSNMSAIEVIEYQANYCAAAFLMPREAATAEFLKTMGLRSSPPAPLPKTYDVDQAISELAEKFSVNYTPMKYRLQELKLVSREELSLDEYFFSTGMCSHRCIPIFFTIGVVNQRTRLYTTRKEEGMNKPLKCPVCGKRACDVSDIPKEKLYIELKCPNCNHIVKILCDESAVKESSHNRIAAYAMQAGM